MSPARDRIAPRRFLSVALGLLLAGATPALAWSPPPIPPADIPSGGPVVRVQSSAAAAEQSMRIDRVEDQMRQLNGRIDEMTFTLRQIQEQLQRMQEDTEFRFQELEGGKPRKRSEAPPVAAPAQPMETASNSLSTGVPDVPADLSSGFSMDAGEPPPGAGSGSADYGAPPQPLGTIPADAAGAGSGLGGPLDLSAIARGEPGYQPPPTVAADPGVVAAEPNYSTAPLAPPPADVPAAPSARTQVAAVMQPADARSAYDQAYGYVVSGDYQMAEMSLKQFLADHPKDKMAASAHFWLGESYYARERYRDAADSYLTTYRDYPKSQKAPESLLKLGLSLEGLGEKDAACATYRELQKKYPSAPGQLLSQANAQKTKAGC